MSESQSSITEKWRFCPSLTHRLLAGTSPKGVATADLFPALCVQAHTHNISFFACSLTFFNTHPLWLIHFTDGLPCTAPPSIMLSYTHNSHSRSFSNPHIISSATCSTHSITPQHSTAVPTSHVSLLLTSHYVLQALLNPLCNSFRQWLLCYFHVLVFKVYDRVGAKTSFNLNTCTFPI